MELFDTKFVHFMWDDELEGKKCLVSDHIDGLKLKVERGCYEGKVVARGTDSYPFEVRKPGICTPYTYQFAYYDPNYEVKKAFNEGKKIQIETATGEWADVTVEEPVWTEHDKYRIKPEEKWIAYLARTGDGRNCYLTACKENAWEEVQEASGAKVKLFVGTESEVAEWYKARQKFAEEIKAWEDGKQIQVRCNGSWYPASNPDWNPVIEYRTKPEEEKKWRPYINSSEMIVDFIARFENGVAKAPSYCEPLIWVKGKETDNRYLVFAFCKDGIKFNDDEPLGFKDLLEYYTYLDGSPCGMEA